MKEKETKQLQIEKDIKEKEAKRLAFRKGPNRSNLDTLLGDPMVNTKKGTYKAKEKGQKDKIGINNIGIFEFIFQGLPNPPDLEGVDEDRLLGIKLLL